MIKLNGRTVLVDIDDTIVLWNKSEFPKATHIVIDHAGHADTVVVPHVKNINLVVKFARLGYKVFACSQSGVDWAKAVIKTIEVKTLTGLKPLSEFVYMVCDKPTFYIDDKDSAHWMRRVWRDPKTGEETSYATEDSK